MKFDDFSLTKLKSCHVHPCVLCSTCIPQAENGPATAGRKTARKCMVAGGSHIDLEQVAREQQIKNRKQMEEILASLVTKHGEQLGDKLSLLRLGAGQINGINGSDHSCGTGSAAQDGVAGVNDTVHQKQGRSGQGEFNKVTGKVINALHCSK